MITLRFECGAELPHKGKDSKMSADDVAEFAAHGNRLTVWGYPGRPSDNGRPMMPDGDLAPCLNCPKKRASGWKKQRCWPEDPARLAELQQPGSHIAYHNAWDWHITCRATVLGEP